MNTKHFKLTNETKVINGVTLYRIEALIDLPYHNVKKGDLGGWVQSIDNLKDNAWVADNAQVFDNACVYGYACVSGNAWVNDYACVSDNTRIYGNAWVYGYACVFGYASIYDNARVFGSARVYGNTNVTDNARVRGCARVYGGVCVSGDAQVYGNACVFGDAQIFGGAHVSGDANICNNDDYCYFSQFGSENRVTTAFKLKDGSICINCGCFNGSIDKFITQVKETHKGNNFEKQYLIMVELIKCKFEN